MTDTHSSRISTRPIGDNLADELETLKAKCTALQGALQSALDLLSNCSVVSGVCMCGDSMENHSSPLTCGHSPVDSGAYYASQLMDTLKALEKAGEL